MAGPPTWWWRSKRVWNDERGTNDEEEKRVDGTPQKEEGLALPRKGGRCAKPTRSTRVTHANPRFFPWMVWKLKKAPRGKDEAHGPLGMPRNMCLWKAFSTEHEDSPLDKHDTGHGRHRSSFPQEGTSYALHGIHVRARMRHRFHVSLDVLEGSHW